MQAPGPSRHRRRPGRLTQPENPADGTNRRRLLPRAWLRFIFGSDRFRLVAELNGDGVRVRQACYALGVSTSGFYEWKTRAPSARSIRHAWLTGLIG